MVGKLIPIDPIKCLLDRPRVKYPVNVIGYDKDGDLIGTIDEDKLSAARRIILQNCLG